MADDEENVSKEEVTYVNAMGDDLADAYSTLMYVDLKIENKSVVTIVDTGAMHTFVSFKLFKSKGCK